MSIRRDIPDSPALEEARQATIRALSYPAAIGAARSLIAKTREVDLVTASGMFIGRGAKYDVDMPRMCAVVERTIKGVHFKMLGKRLAEAHSLRVFSCEMLSVGDLLRVQQTIINTAINTQPLVAVRDVVCVWRAPVDTDPESGGWVLLFYGHVPFVGLVFRTADLKSTEA